MLPEVVFSSTFVSTLLALEELAAFMFIKPIKDELATIVLASTSRVLLVLTFLTRATGSFPKSFKDEAAVFSWALNELTLPFADSDPDDWPPS